MAEQKVCVSCGGLVDAWAWAAAGNGPVQHGNPHTCIRILQAALAAERGKVTLLRETLTAVRRKHYVNEEDYWWNCPASGESYRDNIGPGCDCGADRVNGLIDNALAQTAGDTPAQAQEG